MGNDQNKGGMKGSQAYKQTEDSSFFKKQMIIHSKVLTIDKKFTLDAQIGKGTYSLVFKGKSVRSNRPRCIKRIDKSKSGNIQHMLMTEFDILKTLDHPNVMSIYGLYEDNKYFYFVTELIKGQQLFAQFYERKRFEENQAFEIFKQVVMCVNYLHISNIMHRDIKLQNMIYDPKTKIVKVIDFGSSLEFTSDKPSLYKMVGTPSYIAPQVIGKHYNKMCDVWSMGVFLHLLLTGAAPFSGKSQEEIFGAVTNAQPNLSSPFYEKIPKAKELVQRMLEKSPQKRITIPEIIKHPWFQGQLNKQSLNPADHECMLNIFNNMRRFSTLKISDIQLGVLVFIVNFIVLLDNEDSVIRCFHWIDSEGDGVVTEEELANALVDYEDRQQKKAKQEASEIMRKIDFNGSKDIDYSEFLVAAIPLTTIINDDTLESAFRVIDSDSSGKLSPNELKDHLGEHVSEMHYQKIISFYDMDKDGEISLKEFKEMMKKVIV